MKGLINRIVKIALILVFSLTLSAESYNLYINDLSNTANCKNTFGGNQSYIAPNPDIKINYIDITYDDTTETITLEVSADDSGGELANLIHIILTDGPMPREGENVHLYLDAENEKTTIYTYNGRPNSTSYTEVLCNNERGSWEKAANMLEVNAERILSSDTTFNSDVSELSIIDTVDGPITTRIFRTVIDLTNVNNHSSWVMSEPYFSARNPVFDGMQISEEAGIWFWATSDATASYNNGFINSLSMSECTICDSDNIETETKLMCLGSEISVNPVTEGNPTVISFNVMNNDFDDNSPASVIVNFGTLPTGAKTSIPEGGEIIFDASGKATITIDYTPRLGDKGSYSFQPTFTKIKENEVNQLITQCEAVLEVTEAKPECEQADANAALGADEEARIVAETAIDLNKLYKRIRKRLGKKANNIDEHDPLAIHSEKVWKPFHTITGSEETYLYSCINTVLCTGFKVLSLDSEISVFSNGIDELNTIAENRAKAAQKTLKKYLIHKYKEKNGGVITSTDKKKAKKKAKTRIKKNYLNKINSATSSASTFLNFHVETFGTERLTCPNANIIEE